MMRWALLLLAVIGCDNRGSTPDWSRMITQPKVMAYGSTTLFDDGAAMRPVPAGTVARLPDGRVAGYGDDRPPSIDRALLERGRNRFEIICAACHGVDGDGRSPVARNMQRRRPPSLQEPRLVALTPQAMVRVIADGYGLMPSYATMLPVADRWAVVAYVRTLQLASTASLDRLPTSLRDDIARRLP
jgi:mono/diheme cytochrome c family protein